MGSRGPVPKDEPLARERAERAKQAAKTKVIRHSNVYGYELPEGDWHEHTVSWWDTWRKSPQASLFTGTDWSFLLDTALLHTKFWNDDATVAGELRQRVAKFGATPEDRARLKLEVTEPETVKPEQRAADPRRVTALKVINGS